MKNCGGNFPSRKHKMFALLLKNVIIATITMISYDMCREYLQERKHKFPETPLYSIIYDLFVNKDELAWKMFKDLKEGALDPSKGAGAAFTVRFRKLYKKGHPLNVFIKNFQNDMTNLEKSLEK